MTLGERITEIRKSMGFSQREFCENIGIAEMKFYGWKKGSVFLMRK